MFICRCVTFVRKSPFLQGAVATQKCICGQQVMNKYSELSSLNRISISLFLLTNQRTLHKIVLKECKSLGLERVLINAVFLAWLCCCSHELIAMVMVIMCRSPERDEMIQNSRKNQGVFEGPHPKLRS